MNDEQNTKERILKTAAEIFAEHGFEQTSMRVIAEKSNVTKPAVYYYFPDKKHLFEEIIKLALVHASANLKMIDASSKPAVEKLYDVVMARFGEILDHPEIARFTFNVMSGNIPFGISVDLLTELKPHMDFLYKIIENGRKNGEFRSDFDIQSFMFCLFGAINTYIMRFFRLNINELNLQRAKLLVDTLVEGIANRDYVKES
ncbi:MAG: hypothetical protein COT43_07280 [Candidatus Marinimicrobia bacterium CG08_land_8_20_14_0_20_45_22]|nr:MAG: hypothetical protein COT43_07280 [Candidatus Marinimicrobia bacterium CG08_land_8_20_14_0_20_45_22]